VDRLPRKTAIYKPQVKNSSLNMSTRFLVCFPSEDGVHMVCQHRGSGNWIVFPIGKSKRGKQETPSKKERISKRNDEKVG